MYHGLRKAFATTVKQTVKDDSRVGAASDAFERLDKGVASLRWALDNFEATWTAQSEFCKYMPLIATDIYASDDVAASEVISNYTAAATALKFAASAPVLGPVRSELNSLTDRVKKLDAQRTEWLRCISDKAYYDEKYAKIAAASEKNSSRDAEKEKRALSKREQAADKLVILTSNLADEFENCHREKLAVADKVMMTIASAQSTNARRADITTVYELMHQYRFGARAVPIPRVDDAVAQKLTGISSRRRSSADSTPPSTLNTSHSAPVIQAPPPDYPQPALSTQPQHISSTKLATKSLDSMPSSEYRNTAYTTNPYATQPYGSPPPPPNGIHHAAATRPNSTGHRRTASASSSLRYTNSWNSQHDIDTLSNGVNNMNFSAPLNERDENDEYTPSAPPMPTVPSTNGLFAFKSFARQPL